MYEILFEQFKNKKIDEMTLHAAVVKGFIKEEEKEKIILLVKAGVLDGI